ncbi:MAG: hypothetical protein DMG21_12025 [Acidobacteria bacterium]|nr:MAG: hypothetical protein DMG21_12025 [Acidobacteriota bacterium]
MPQELIERRIRRAALLVALGLLVQLATLAWTHPLSFVAFLSIGCPLEAAGVLYFLYALVSHGSSHPPKAL